MTAPAAPAQATPDNQPRHAGTPDDLRRDLLIYRKALDASDDPTFIANVYHAMGGIEFRLGNAPDAMANYNRALQMRIDLYDEPGQAETLHELARVARASGMRAQALQFLDMALACDKRPLGQCHTLRLLAAIHAEQGDRAQARDLARQSSDAAAQAGDAQERSASLCQLAAIHADMGDVAQAIEIGNQAYDLSQKINHYPVIAQAMCLVGKLHQQQGNLDMAMRYLPFAQQAALMARDLATYHDCTGRMTRITFDAGKLPEAKRVQTDAIYFLSRLGDWNGVVGCLQNLAHIDRPRAVQYLAEAAKVTLFHQVLTAKIVDVCVALVSELGPEHPAAPMAAGMAMFRAMSFPQNDPERAGAMQKAVNAIASCALSRGVSVDEGDEWVNRHRLNDPEFLFPQLEQRLAELVPAGQGVLESGPKPGER